VRKRKEIKIARRKWDCQNYDTCPKFELAVARAAKEFNCPRKCDLYIPEIKKE